MVGSESERTLQSLPDNATRVYTQTYTHGNPLPQTNGSLISSLVSESILTEHPGRCNIYNIRVGASEGLRSGSAKAATNTTYTSALFHHGHDTCCPRPCLETQQLRLLRHLAPAQRDPFFICKRHLAVVFIMPAWLH